MKDSQIIKQIEIMVKVYFETEHPGHAKLIAIFDDEDTYMACFPALEKLKKKHGWDIITESVVQHEMTLNEVNEIIDQKIYKS